MPKFCPTCGKPLQFENAEICPSCGVRLQAPPSVPAEIRIPFLAVVLSFFFPGWGQWYNGKTWEGLGFFGACFASYLFMIILAIIMSNQSSASLLVVILFVVYIGIWVYGMYNAYTTAKQINQREVDFQGKSGLFWLPIVFIILGIVLIIVSAVIAAFVFGMAGNVS